MSSSNIKSPDVVSNLLNTSTAIVQSTNLDPMMPANLLNTAIQIANAKKPAMDPALSTKLLNSAIEIASSRNSIDKTVSENLLNSVIQIANTQGAPGVSADKQIQSLLNIAMGIAFPKQSMVSGFPDFTGFPGFPDFSSILVIPEQSKRIGETILTVDENAAASEIDIQTIPEKHKATKSVVKPIYQSSKTKPDAYESTLFEGMPDSLLIDNSKEIGSLVDQVTEINANLKKETELLKKE